MRRAPVPDLGLTVLRSISMFVIAISLGTIAFIHGNYAAVAIVMALPPPALLGILFFRETTSPREVLLVLLAFVGAAVVIGSRSGATVQLDWPLLCAMGATLFMGFGIIARKRQSSYLNAYETTLLMLLTATVIMGLISVAWMGWKQILPALTMRSISVALVAGAANVAFLTLSHFATPRLKSVVINNLLALQPVFGVVVGVTIFGENLNIWEWAGCGLILLSVILIANRSAVRTRRP